MPGPDDRPGLAGARVLVVDRDGFCGTYLAGVLARAGAEVLGPFVAPGEAVATLDRVGSATVAVLTVRRDEPVATELLDRLAGVATPVLLITAGEPAWLATLRTAPTLDHPLGACEVAGAAADLLAGLERHEDVPIVLERC